MDPDGDYESHLSTRSIGDILPKDAKLDSVDDNNKKCDEDEFYDCKGNDEEMCLKPSPKANTSKVLLSNDNEGSVDLKPSAPLADDLGCLASAPPLEPSLHPSPEDDATAPTTPESSHPPEPPGCKDDPIDGGNHIPDSVALPIGLDNADRALPIASVVPIITDATGAEYAAPLPQPEVSSSTSNQNDSANAPPQQQSTNQGTRTLRSTAASTSRAPARRVPSFFRQSSTHPAPAAATLADPQPPQEERDKSDSQGCKCTPCKKVMAVAIFVVAIIAAVGIGLTLSDGPDEPDEPNEPGDPGINTNNAKYPNCHVANLSWLNDGMCDGGRYDKGECGWDGGDCLFDKFSNTKCTGSIGSIWTDRTRAWCQNKCTEQGIICAAYDFSGGKCRIFASYSSKTNKSNSKCYVKNDHANVVGSYPNCNVPNLNKINDGNCDGGQYDTEQCGWDGGDCIVQGYAECQVANPNKIGDGNCDGGQYNTEQCGWDGEDCIIPDWPSCHVNNPAGLGNGQCNEGSKANSIECGFDGGDCTNLDIAKIKNFITNYPNCRADADEFSWIGDGICCRNCGGSNTAECGWDGGDCLEFNSRYPDCHVEHHYWIGDGDCDGGQYNTAECGYDGGDCEEFNREARYPNCNVNEMYWLNDDFCDSHYGYNTADCGWDGGDCLFTRHYGQACTGSTSSTWIDKTRAWCQAKCVDDSNCKAYDFSTANSRCRIFSSFSSLTSRNNSICWVKNNPDCNVRNMHWLNDGVCDGSDYNRAECGYDGGDCLFDEHSDKKCNGSVRSTWSNKSRAWCQTKCLDEGSSCKAYDIDVYWESEKGTCRIFSSYSSKSSKNDSLCFKKK